MVRSRASSGLSTPSLGITKRLSSAARGTPRSCFQLPLSGSRLRTARWTLLACTCFQLPLSGSHGLKTRNLCRLKNSSFQLPLSGSRKFPEIDQLGNSEAAFNSLSRDHLHLRRMLDFQYRQDFQLPLSGSQRWAPERTLTRRGRRLSTPSLGITELK